MKLKVQSSNPTPHEALLRRWFQEVWLEENEDTIRELFVPESREDEKVVSGHDRDGLMGQDDYVAFHRTLLSLLQKVDIQIVQMFEHGDWVTIRCYMTAEKRENPEIKAFMDGCIIVRITDGKLREGHNYFDFINFFERLELLPENTLASCFHGIPPCSTEKHLP